MRTTHHASRIPHHASRITFSLESHPNLNHQWPSHWSAKSGRLTLPPGASPYRHASFNASPANPGRARLLPSRGRSVRRRVVLARCALRAVLLHILCLGQNKASAPHFLPKTNCERPLSRPSSLPVPGTVHFLDTYPPSCRRCGHVEGEQQIWCHAYFMPKPPLRQCVDSVCMGCGRREEGVGEHRTSNIQHPMFNIQPRTGKSEPGGRAAAHCPREGSDRVEAGACLDPHAPATPQPSISWRESGRGCLGGKMRPAPGHRH